MIIMSFINLHSLSLNNNNKKKLVNQHRVVLQYYLIFNKRKN